MQCEMGNDEVEAIGWLHGGWYDGSGGTLELCIVGVFEVMIYRTEIRFGWVGEVLKFVVEGTYHAFGGINAD